MEEKKICWRLRSELKGCQQHSPLPGSCKPPLKHLSSRTRHSKKPQLHPRWNRNDHSRNGDRATPDSWLLWPEWKMRRTKRGQAMWLWGRTEPPSRSKLTCGKGLGAPLCSPLACTSHFRQTKKSPLPSLPPMAYQLEVLISYMPDFSPELCSLRERSSISIMPTICPLNIQKFCSIIANYSNLLWLWCDSRALQNEKKTTEYWRKSKAPFLNQG